MNSQNYISLSDEEWVRFHILNKNKLFLYGTLASELETVEIKKFWKDFRKIAEDYMCQENRSIAYHEKIDILLNLLIERDVRYGYPRPFCYKGCANCCNEVVACTDEEATLIVEYCNENNIEIDYDKLQRQLKFISFDLNRNHSGETNWSEQTAEDQSCIFLDPFGHFCRIWKHRPFVCRVHLAESTNKYCKPHNGVQDARAIGICYPEWSYILSVIFTIHSDSIKKTMGQLLLKHRPLK